MSTATEITPNTDESKALQNAIQKDLIARGYSTEGDEVMAEFVLVMLCNQKNPDQITTELNDLIGSDFDASFTTWLFQTVAQHYPKSKQAEHAAPPAVPDTPNDFNYAQQSQQQAPRGGNRKSGVNAFGMAWNQPPGGQKRQHDFGGRDDRSQRPRTDGPPVHAPTGPKHPLPTDGVPGAGAPRRLFDRLGPGPSPSGNGLPVMSPMGPALYNPQTGEFAPVQGMPGPQGRGGGNRRHQQGPPGQPQSMMFPGGGVPFFIPPGMMPQFPQGGMFPPQMLAQFQQQMQQQGGPGMPAPNGFMPGPPPSIQSQSPAPTQSVPTKPLDDSLCKYATECKNAYCKFAHPSPAATTESGLVLSSEPCDKQLECTDLDCSRSHISPQARDPANSRAPPANDNAGVPRPSGPPQSSFGAAPSGKPCKFGGACTRPDCVFTHPWDKSGTPCRFGANCTRGDCHFTHPPGHRPYKASRGGYQQHYGAPKGNRTAVFNTTSAVTEKLKETESEKAALSERMKKFGVQDGETERIIPGQAQEAEEAKRAVAQDESAVKKEE